MQLYSVSLILLVLIFCFVSGFLERIFILLVHGLAHLNELVQKETEQGFEAELKNCRKKINCWHVFVTITKLQKCKH